MMQRSWPVALLLAACSEAPTPPPPIAAQSALPPADGGAAPDALASTPEACLPGAAITLFVAPRAPRAGALLRVLAVAEKPLDAELSIHFSASAGAGAPRASSSERHGGPPYFWYAEIPAAMAGVYRAELTGAERACQEIAVHRDPVVDKSRAWGAVWPVRAAWTGSMESLYSAWIEKLFDAPLEEQPTWPALHEVLRDSQRNLLHDYLGAEDSAHALVIDPDCADLPYFLRAYFAFKLGLPFGYSRCTRGGSGQPPRCLGWHSNLEARPQRSTPEATFGDFLRITLADTVHSGTGRAPAEDDASDYYPVPLSLDSLRPGTIYADPYGHVLVVAKRIPERPATFGPDTTGGVLLAVDGQPDGTISRRRFWRGNFLFALDPALGSPGFKRFRPVVVKDGRARALENREIEGAPGYGDYSLSQYRAGVEGFYDKMDEVLSPSPLDPSRAMLETIQALEEQVKGRVLSVHNGQKYWEGGGARIDMPEGAAIFEADGPWEDFSTPSRDLRLLIAIDIVEGFPDRVARRPVRFAMPAGKSEDEVRGELTALLGRELQGRTFSYPRSDGSAFTLSLAEVVARAPDLEMAYNPNDCAEARWGAPAESDERATCRRRAPPGQLRQMRRYRAWFHERRRPPRG